MGDWGISGGKKPKNSRKLREIREGHKILKKHAELQPKKLGLW